jgi:hypothetical protein
MAIFPKFPAVENVYVFTGTTSLLYAYGVNMDSVSVVPSSDAV